MGGQFLWKIREEMIVNIANKFSFVTGNHKEGYIPMDPLLSLEATD